MAGEIKMLSLVKGRHQFCFRYEVGDEARVLESLVEMVNRRDLPFDWFDAAVLTQKAREQIAAAAPLTSPPSRL